MSETVHAGHRERQKTKFLEHGLDAFTDVEALELLLYYAIPRRDTNALAHALLDRFGSLRGVMDAEAAALQRVEGIGEGAAALVQLVTALHRRYVTSAPTRRVTIRSSEDAGSYLMPQFAHDRVERSLLLTLDVAGRVIRCRTLAEGGPGTVQLVPRELVELVLEDKAARVILAHNHISGVALPSAADVDVTRRIARMLRMIDVELMDHIIVGEDDFVSMRDSGAFAD